MKISYNWLKKYLPLENSVDEISQLLTSIGLEVEEVKLIDAIEGGLRNVVTAEVLTCEKHPDADKLKVATVRIGAQQPLQIVCGAPNIAAAQKVVVALEGASLFPSGAHEKFQIKKTRIRGIESQGMICSEKELGLSHFHEGILVLPSDTPVGMPAADYFNLQSDYVFEIGLTPNRSDAFSHIGVARDLKAALNVRKQTQYSLRLPTPTTWKYAKTAKPFFVEIHNTTACPRYSGVVISGIEVKESPQWLKNSLRAIGVRSINNVVDITNFVLHEYGQPLHAFDAEKINGQKVIVRNAYAGEKFVTLDGVERQLHGYELMICHAEEPMCIAGVFGGANSGVTENTRCVFIESAYFTPSGIRKTSFAHGLRTDAAIHYEKGCDPNITIPALQRAVSLILEIAGGEVASDIIDVYPSKIEPARVEISHQYINKLCGFNIEPAEVQKILNELGIEIVSATEQGYLLSIPTCKTDVKRPADVVEEILRIYGYNRFDIPSKTHSSISFSGEKNETRLENTLSSLLTGWGFYEIASNSITQSSLEQDENLRKQQIKLLNSQTSELDCLRTSLLYGMLEIVAYNQNRKLFDLGFFEFGKTYHRVENIFQENKHLAILLTGYWQAPNWITKGEKVNFYHLKQVVEGVFKKLGIAQANFLEKQMTPFDKGFVVVKHERELCRGGQVKSTLNNRFDVRGEIYYACLDMEQLMTEYQQSKVIFAPLPKYPSVRRDLALVVNRNVAFADIESIAKRESENLLLEVSLFDVYEGEKIPEGKKSCAVSFVFQHPQKTLTDEEVEKIISRLIGCYEKELEASIRM